MDRYDVLIIGSGIGGLISGALLAKAGYKVCILEKNKQIGGALQVYVRQRVIFDTGVHYIGGLGKGENLYQVFKYLDIADELNIVQMDPVFDKIIIAGDDKEYGFAQGYEAFKQNLLIQFPGQASAIEAYCSKIQEVCNCFAMYNLQPGGNLGDKVAAMELDTKQFIESITADVKLQSVLAGNNMLYAGQPDKTPFYVHALILNSYIQSSWKFKKGGSQMAKLLSRRIHSMGGRISIHSEVVKLIEDKVRLTELVLKDGTVLKADIFISNVHPVKTLEMTDAAQIRSSYRNRLAQLENSVSSFTVDIILKPDCFPVLKSNYYYHKEGQIWNGPNYHVDEWPLVYAVFMPPQETGQYARSLSILTYMRFEEVAEWSDSFNTVSVADDRGASYEAFKKERAEKLICLVEEKFPGLRASVDSFYTATPLSYRDYIGTDDGSMYGIVRDYRDPMKTLISPRTKLENLYFTGQNLQMHGVLGAAMTALSTVIAITGNQQLVEDVRNA